jgi:uncharacterized integral membrane protein
MATTPTPQSEPTGAAVRKPAARRSRGEAARLAAVAILAVLATLFAVVNLDKVRVNLLFGSTDLPLIVVIVGCLAIGAVFGAVLARRGRRGRRRRG